MSVSHPVASRRTTVVAGLAGLVALSGCDYDAGSEEPRQDVTTAPPADADAGLVDEVQQRIREAAVVVAGGRRQDPGLRRELGSLAALHGDHFRALGDEPASFPKSGRGRTLEQVRAAETKLQRQLTDAAVHADSGTLAKLLASMAAAVAQHLAVL